MAAGLRVTVEDLETGETATREIAAGDYVLICLEPCYQDSVQTYSVKGTHVVTIKGIKAKSG